MNTYVAYDKNTFQILGFIRNDYTALDETKEIFKNFENYEVARTDLEIPNFFSNYKVVIGNEKIIRFEELSKEGEENNENN